jgi:hypothetical protein
MSSISVHNSMKQDFSWLPANGITFQLPAVTRAAALLLTKVHAAGSEGANADPGTNHTQERRNRGKIALSFSH